MAAGLFYNAATVDGATSRVDPNGPYRGVDVVPGFAVGWTTVIGQ